MRVVGRATRACLASQEAGEWRKTASATDLYRAQCANSNMRTKAALRSSPRIYGFQTLLDLLGSSLPSTAVERVSLKLVADILNDRIISACASKCLTTSARSNVHSVLVS